MSGFDAGTLEWVSAQMVPGAVIVALAHVSLLLWPGLLPLPARSGARPPLGLSLPIQTPRGHGLLVLVVPPGPQEGAPRCQVSMTPPFSPGSLSAVVTLGGEDKEQDAARVVDRLRALGALDALELDPGDGI